MTGLSSWRVTMIFLCCVSCTRTNHSPLAEVSAHTGDIARGKLLYQTCGTCHGERGEGNAKLQAPAVANLDTWYLYTQLKNFKSGIRGDVPQDTLGVQMAAVARSLKDTTDMLDLVAYIESLADVRPAAVATGNLKNGERIYQTICGSCHGPGAKGNELMHAPRLNGLEPWYLRNQIAKFKMSFRGAHPDDPYGAPMIPIMALVKDDQAIEDVIAYIQSTVEDQSQ